MHRKSRDLNQINAGEPTNSSLRNPAPIIALSLYNILGSGDNE